MNSEAEVTTKELKDPIAQLNREDNSDLADYIRGLSGGAAFQVKVARTFPKTFRGHAVGGHLVTTPEQLTEDDIKEQFGGGKFTIQVQRQQTEGKGAGKYLLVGQRTIEIAGEPVIPESAAPPVLAPPIQQEDTSLSKHALTMTERQLDEQRKRADLLEDRYLKSIEDNSGSKRSEPIVTILMTQIDAQNRRMEALQRELSEAQKVPPVAPTSPVQDKLLEKLLLDDASRIEAMRTAHESELRQLRSQHAEDVKRIEDRYERIRADDVRGRDRSIEDSKTLYAMQIENLKGAYEARLQSGAEEIKRLTRQVESLNEDIKELRKLKEKPVLEQLSEIMTLKDAISDMSGKEETSTFDKIMDRAGPLAEVVIGKMASVGQEKAVAQAQAQAQQAQRLVTAQKAARKAKAANVVRPPVPEGEQPLPELSKADVANLVNFVENAVRADQDPAMFAKSVRSMVPTPILNAVMRIGVDKFIDSVAQLNQASPLHDVKGRTFLRKVGEALGQP